MLTVGDRLPDFRLKAVVSLAPGEEFRELTSHELKGQWLVLFYWPMDFTFVCPTEIVGFAKRHADFVERGASVIGASTDTHYVHLAWRQRTPELTEVPFPMLGDPTRALANRLGIIHRDDGVPLRVTFIIDPEGIIRWVAASDLNVGRSVEETLRVLEALQTDALTPCEWRPGDAVEAAA